MTKRIFYFALLASFIYYLINSFFFTEAELSLYVPGSVAGRDIVADFDFEVNKTEEQILLEQQKAIKNTPNVYEISNEVNYDIINKLNLVFTYKPFSKINQLNNYGFIFTKTELKLLQNQKFATKVYNILAKKIPHILKTGFYYENLPDTIFIKQNQKLIKTAKKNVFNLSSAQKIILQNVTSKNIKKILKTISKQLLTNNLYFLKNETLALQNNNKNSVSIILAKVHKNEIIISKNRKITKSDFIKLQQYSKLLSKKLSFFNLIGIGKKSMGIFAFIVLFFFLKVCGVINTNILKKNTNIVILLSLLLLSYLNNALIIYFNLNPYLNIFAFSILLVVSLYSSSIAVAFCLSQLMLSAFIPVWLVLPFYASVLAVIMCYVLYMHNKNNYEPLGLVLSLLGFQSILMIVLELANSTNLTHIYTNLIYSIISGVLSATLFLIVLPLLQKKLQLAAKQILLELLDFNNPLLKMLANKAPGTYHHSINVGIISENLASAIGCDPLLARVGSYYHDVGKLENPSFFIENNKNSSELHNKLDFTQSAALLKDHIAQGEFLAKKYSLPLPIIEIIRQHHGTSTIKYFYLKAIEEYGEVDESKFRYTGPKPQSKEAAIVMISDIVESTASSLQNPEKKSLQQIIDNTINQLVKAGQLEFTELTLKDLNIIKLKLLPVLEGIHHRRIPYPDQEIR